MNDLLLPTDGCERCMTLKQNFPVHPYRVERGRRACWAPARFYPQAPADAAALAAVARTGFMEPQGTKTLWQVTLMPRCTAHAPAGLPPSWVGAEQREPCDYVEPGDGLVAFYDCPRCHHHWWTAWDKSAEDLTCPGCELCGLVGDAA